MPGMKSTRSDAVTAAKLDRTRGVAERVRATPSVNESWVRPDGCIERNVRMDIVVSASKKSIKAS